MKLPAVLALAALVVAGSRSMAAQGAARPHGSLDSAQVRIGKAILILRDSLSLVDGAAQRLPRDLKTASDAALRSRAREISSRCAAAARSVTPARSFVAETPRPDPDPKQVRVQMVEGLALLKSQLDRCVLDFLGLAAPDRAEELRDYGIGRAERLQQSIRRYEVAVRPYFFAALGLTYLPDAGGAEPASK